MRYFDIYLNYSRIRITRAFNMSPKFKYYIKNVISKVTVQEWTGCLDILQMELGRKAGYGWPNIQPETKCQKRPTIRLSIAAGFYLECNFPENVFPQNQYPTQLQFYLYNSPLSQSHLQETSIFLYSFYYSEKGKCRCTQFSACHNAVAECSWVRFQASQWNKSAKRKQVIFVTIAMEADKSLYSAWGCMASSPPGDCTVLHNDPTAS